MVIFPNCKINLGLHILRKRPDGYHDLQTVFYPVPLKDALEIVRADTPGGSLHYSHSGIPVEGDVSANLCSKAYELIRKDFPNLPSTLLHLHKNIPMGAGLGGGSSDGAFTLILLNQCYDLQLSEEQLIAYALQLGSDCPFFILNRPCIAEGRGEKMQPISLNLSDYQLVLVNPGVHISTGWAFSQITPQAGRESLPETINRPMNEWKDTLTNDFEEPVCKAYPEIRKIREDLYLQGALYASLSGSGSTVFGIFPKGIRYQSRMSGYKVYELPAV